MSQIFKTIHRFGTARKREWNLREPDWGGRGRLHRTNGPAIEYSDGRKEWWVLGCYIAREYRGRRTLCDNSFGKWKRPFLEGALGWGHALGE